MKNKLLSNFIIIFTAFIFFAPISFPISSYIIHSTVESFNKITGIEKRRLEKKRQQAEDEKLYGTGFDKPISENFRQSSMSAKALCVSKGKESLNTLLNQNREFKDKVSQYSDVYEKAREINEDHYNSIKDIRVNLEPKKPSIKATKPIYDFIPSVYAKIENRFIECIDQGSTGYGNKPLGLKIGEICEFMPHIQYTKTQLIPDKNSIGNPSWNATVDKKYYLYDSFPYNCKI